MNNSYHENIKLKNIEKLRELQSNLPAFCTVFFAELRTK